MMMKLYGVKISTRIHDQISQSEHIHLIVNAPIINELVFWVVYMSRNLLRLQFTYDSLSAVVEERCGSGGNEMGAI